MSFRCGKCGQAIGPKMVQRKDYDGSAFFEQVPSKPTRVVVERRAREYPPRHQKTRRQHINDPGGMGEEIVKEIDCCAPCANRVA